MAVQQMQRPRFSTRVRVLQKEALQDGVQPFPTRRHRYRQYIRMVCLKQCKTIHDFQTIFQTVIATTQNHQKYRRLLTEFKRCKPCSNKAIELQVFDSDCEEIE